MPDVDRRLRRVGLSGQGDSDLELGVLSDQLRTGEIAISSGEKYPVDTVDLQSQFYSGMLSLDALDFLSDLHFPHGVQYSQQQPETLYSQLWTPEKVHESFCLHPRWGVQVSALVQFEAIASLIPAFREECCFDQQVFDAFLQALRRSFVPPLEQFFQERFTLYDLHNRLRAQVDLTALSPMSRAVFEVFANILDMYGGNRFPNRTAQSLVLATEARVYRQFPHLHTDAVSVIFSRVFPNVLDEVHAAVLPVILAEAPFFEGTSAHLLDVHEQVRQVSQDLLEVGVSVRERREEPERYRRQQRFERQQSWNDALRTFDLLAIGSFVAVFVIILLLELRGQDMVDKSAPLPQTVITSE